MASKSAASVRKTSTETMSLRLPPAASMARLRFSSMRRVWAVMSPSMMAPVAGSFGTWVAKTRSPARTVPLTGAFERAMPASTTSNIGELPGAAPLQNPVRPGGIDLGAVIGPPLDVVQEPLRDGPGHVGVRIDEVLRGRRIGLLVDGNCLVGAEPARLHLGAEAVIDVSERRLGVLRALRDAVGLDQDLVLVPL